VQKARRIAAQHGLKYIPVHHMEAHALIARAGTAVQFPYLCLLVSGGHNMIVIVEGVGSYTLLGSTLDDAVGDIFVCCKDASSGLMQNFNVLQGSDLIKLYTPLLAHSDSILQWLECL